MAVILNVLMLLAALWVLFFAFVYGVVGLTHVAIFFSRCFNWLFGPLHRQLERNEKELPSSVSSPIDDGPD